MSIRFERFVKRMGRNCEFLPFKNKMLDSMKEDAIAKYKNYPRLIEDMKNKWENAKKKDGKKGNYKQEKDIGHLLADYVNDLFLRYLKVLFPFRNKGLIIKGVQTPSRLDFIVTTEYHYSIQEIKIIKDVLESKEFPKNPDVIKISKFLLLYSISSFAIAVEEIFKPFAFMPQKVTATENLDGTVTVSVSTQGREQ